MKLLHLGDMHLGKSLGEFDLYEDQKYILDRIIHIAREKAVDAVMIAGDVYDKVVTVEFISRVRAERKFTSIEELKNQMQNDIAYGRTFFS